MDDRKKTGGNRKKPSYKERQGISYEQGEDPPFLAQMKQKLGYKEYTVDDKFTKEDEVQGESVHSGDDEDDILNVPVERRPQIVVLEPGKDLTNEQLQKEIDKKREEEDKQKILQGKIIFRKTQKRSSNPNDSKEEINKKKLKPEQPSRQPVHKRLLSFGNEDEEE
ncbi:hypothetical protein ACQ4LE_000374 [Meloidogyne hapla]|uniref:DUF4604 domain-containing protein n=1 Tax=Meloidogyne hapla TaxID=6305 RepID=A0A1I8BP67_MELHA